jgi:hypothetical protein
LAVAEGFEPSHGRINSAVPYQLGDATKKLIAGAGAEPAGSGLQDPASLMSITPPLLCSSCNGCGDEI